ncbi:MAG: hypothetical protein Q8R31_01680 [Candidatus Omnitrophota bacterium]|nr:hypothetical protein [Candidatus Omnitrophota bacterium]
MSTKIPIGLIMLTIVAVLMDCYAGRGFFLMTAMSLWLDYSLLYFGTVITLLMLFFASIIGLCKLRKWGYYIFFILTFIFSFLLLLMDIEYLVEKYIALELPQIFLIVFFLTFTIYFLKPSTRKLFERKGKGEQRLSVKWARINVVVIGIFYIISGFWEYFLGLNQMKWMPPGIYFLLDVYRGYAVNLGRVTILVGILLCAGILFRLKFIRLLTLILAWWNLFTAPLIHIGWYIYAILIKGFLVADFWFNRSEFYSAILILVLTFSRTYIISMLKISKAGYIFLREKQGT